MPSSVHQRHVLRSNWQTCKAEIHFEFLSKPPLKSSTIDHSVFDVTPEQQKAIDIWFIRFSYYFIKVLWMTNHKIPNSFETVWSGAILSKTLSLSAFKQHKKSRDLKWTRLWIAWANYELVYFDKTGNWNAKRLLGIRETSFNGRNTLNERNMRKSTSTFASANTVIELTTILNRISSTNCFLDVDWVFVLAKQKRELITMKLYLDNND